MLNQEFFVGQLEEELNNVIQNGVPGVKKIKQIMNEINDDTFSPEVTILYNEHFELVFIKESLSIEFRTTRSNQVIDREYMNMMLHINQSQNIIKSIISSIIRFKGIED